MSYNAIVNTKSHTKNIALCGLFTSLIMALTMFPQIGIGVGGYVHAGDTVIFLACILLPLPYAMLAAGTGSALADLITGWGIYAPFTLIIKAVMALVVCLISGKRRNIWIYIIAFLIASVVMQAGYLGVNYVMLLVANNTEELALLIPSSLLGLMQTAVSVPLAVIIATIIPKQFIYTKEKHQSEKNI